MYVEVSSNGIKIDTTPPTIERDLTLSSIGTIEANTIIMRSTVRVFWEVYDHESSVETQYISLSSHIGGDYNKTAIKVRSKYFL